MVAITPAITLQHCALLVVDMQNEFLDPEGAFAEKRSFARRVSSTTRRFGGNTARLLGAMRQAGAAVVHLKRVFPSDYADCFLSPA